jgi:murein DD-endopeptidase MepM/ murein hydrolase activator NlpD
MPQRFRSLCRVVLSLLAVTAFVQHSRVPLAVSNLAAGVIPSASASPKSARPVRGTVDPATFAPPVVPPDLGTEMLVIPVQGVDKSALQDTWGQARSNFRHHEAIDIMAARGTPALAAADGVVLKIFESHAGGHTLYLKATDGTTVYYYAHLDRYADGMIVGTAVTRGTIVGYVGTTGNAAPDAPHLHFGIEQLPPTGEWWKGVAVNPYPILLERGTTVR